MPRDICLADDLDDNSLLDPFWIFFAFISFIMMALMLIRYAERSNRFTYEDRLTRIIAGFLQMIARTFHASNEILDIPEDGAVIITLGPHRTGAVESIAAASNVKGGKPLHFFATSGFNNIPVIGPTVGKFLDKFQTILVTFQPKEANANGKKKNSANSNAIELGTQAINDGGRIVLYPQGNFAKLGEEPPIIYSGAARIAISTRTPIHVIRLDGLWCIKNPLIPRFIRNNLYYRAFLSLFHMNNVTTTLCSVIDFHLQPDNESLSEDELIFEINAQLYAFYRHTEELTSEDIEDIKEDIAAGEHRTIWKEAFEQYLLEKQMKAQQEEENKSGEEPLPDSPRPN